MKASKDTLQLLSLAAVLILSTSSCNKPPIEKVKFPKKIELLSGQYCLPWVAIEYEHASTLYDHNYIFKEWVSDNTEIAVTRGDTVVALSSGKCELTALYHDELGEHTANCSVIVSDPILPSPEDTIFAHYGDTVKLCNFKFPGSHTIQYELEYGSGYSYSGTLNSYYQSVIIGNPPIEFSPIYIYYLNMIMPNYNLISFRIFSNALDIDVTIPIVTLPSDESKEP